MLCFIYHLSLCRYHFIHHPSNYCVLLSRYAYCNVNPCYFSLNYYPDCCSLFFVLTCVHPFHLRSNRLSYNICSLSCVLHIPYPSTRLSTFNAIHPSTSPVPHSITFFSKRSTYVFNNVNIYYYSPQLL